MKVLLTSCGFETENIKNKFVNFLEKDVSAVKAVFIPTAAIDADAIGVLPKCMNDLLKCGILKENIFVYDLHKPMSADELAKYDVVYICGGDTGYLLDRINEADFSEALKTFVGNNKVVVGVSAGSIVFANNLENNLGLLRQALWVHCSDDNCEQVGDIDLTRTDEIKIGNTQALVLESSNRAYMIE